ncbi:hypothetical protein BD414DRAFT_473365 [Trametes punicea]|nr:hypothetical protein BD414DRAFT_473365 [Trametes punicea]
MHTSKRTRRQSPGMHEGDSSADRYTQRSPRSTREGHGMRREESASRSRHDVDDRWRMADTPERYAFDRRDEQRRGGESNDDDGRSRPGHNDVRDSSASERPTWPRPEPFSMFFTGFSGMDACASTLRPRWRLRAVGESF